MVSLEVHQHRMSYLSLGHDTGELESISSSLACSMRCHDLASFVRRSWDALRTSKEWNGLLLEPACDVNCPVDANDCEVRPSRSHGSGRYTHGDSTDGCRFQKLERTPSVSSGAKDDLQDSLKACCSLRTDAIVDELSTE